VVIHRRPNNECKTSWQCHPHGWSPASSLRTVHRHLCRARQQTHAACSDRETTVANVSRSDVYTELITDRILREQHGHLYAWQPVFSCFYYRSTSMLFCSCARQKINRLKNCIYLVTLHRFASFRRDLCYTNCTSLYIGLYFMRLGLQLVYIRHCYIYLFMYLCIYLFIEIKWQHTDVDDRILK